MNPWEQLLDGVDLPFHPDLVVPELHEVRSPSPSHRRRRRRGHGARPQVVATCSPARARRA